MQEKNKRVAIIGLGAFGSSLAVELNKKDADVIAIDINEDLVKSINYKVYNAICLDGTDKFQITKHIGNVDLAIVAIGENFGNTVIITKILKDMGITVYSRASNNTEMQILEAVGADKIYRPEHEQGISRAREIIYSKVKDVFPLGSKMELIATEPGKLYVGKKINELDIRRTYEINIAFIESKLENDEYEYGVPASDHVLKKSDILWVIGTSSNIRKFVQNLT